MNEYLYDSYDNPLEAIADELSQALNSKSVEVQETTTNQIEAGQVSMRQSAARTIRANALHMEESAAGFIRATTVDANESAMGGVVARDVTLDSVTTPILIALGASACRRRGGLSRPSRAA